MDHQNLKLYNFHTDFLSLCNLVKISEIPNSILIDGMDGIGKSTFATHFINYTLSMNEDEPYDIKNYEINAMNRSYKLSLYTHSTLSVAPIAVFVIFLFGGVAVIPHK